MINALGSSNTMQNTSLVFTVVHLEDIRSRIAQGRQGKSISILGYEALEYKALTVVRSTRRSLGIASKDKHSQKMFIIALSLLLAVSVAENIKLLKENTNFKNVMNKDLLLACAETSSLAAKKLVILSSKIKLSHDVRR